MLRKTQEKDAPWAIQLFDLYLCTSNLFKGVTEELATLEPGIDKLHSLYLNLSLRHSQPSDCEVRLLFYNVLHLLFLNKPSTPNKKLRKTVIAWCSYFKTIAPCMTDDNDRKRIQSLTEELPSLFR